MVRSLGDVCKGKMLVPFLVAGGLYLLTVVGVLIGWYMDCCGLRSQVEEQKSAQKAAPTGT